MEAPSFTRESTIRRDAEGRWFHEGERVENAAVAHAFDCWVDRAEDGRYVLKNSVDWVYVEIEGAPITVKSLVVEPERVVLELSDDSTEPLDPATLRQDEAGVLFTDVRSGRLTARFSRKAQLLLEPLVAEDDLGPYLAIGALVARPPIVADPLAPSEP